MHNALHTTQIVIIGAGLSGLYLAHLLTQKYGKEWAQQHLKLFEAADRIGGRVQSLTINNHHLDLGPSWLWPAEQHLIAELISKFNLTIFPQNMNGTALFQMDQHSAPVRYTDQQSYQGAYRIQGGTQKLVSAILATIPHDCIYLDYQLKAITDYGKTIGLQFETSQGLDEYSLTTQQLVLALPPRVAASKLTFKPALSNKLLLLMQNTPTWMAGQAKVVIYYAEAFWLDEGLSGMAMANYSNAVLGEVFDLSGELRQPAALGGFLAMPIMLRQKQQEQLAELILQQLEKLFGPQAAKPLNLEIMDWFIEPYTATQADAEPLLTHPEYGHKWFELDHWNDKLFFCGTETATIAGGYMEGALQSAKRTYQSIQLSNSISTQQQ